MLTDQLGPHALKQAKDGQSAGDHLRLLKSLYLLSFQTRFLLLIFDWRVNDQRTLREQVESNLLLQVFIDLLAQLFLGPREFCVEA